MTHLHYSRHLNENTTSQNQHYKGLEGCSIIFVTNYTKKVEVTNKFLLVTQPAWMHLRCISETSHAGLRDISKRFDLQIS